MPVKHLVLPDVQAKAGNDFSYLTAAGNYIVAKKPDVIVCIGDFADMESLSSYDKGKKSFEGRSYQKDIWAAREAMDALLTPLFKYNADRIKWSKKQYKPRMVLTLGNHENRINRAVDMQRELEGLMSVDDLPYQDWDAVNNRPVNAPSRVQPAINLQNHIQGAMQAKEDIQASIGMYQANLGAPSNESSGVAIDARKQQGESSTAHFPGNLAASIGQVGKLCMQMIPKLIDTKRQLRILGIDGTPGQVTMDPKQTAAVQETPQGLSINPNIGRYDVRVIVGASFATQRTQAQQAFTEMMRAAPQLMPAIAPLWAQTLDVPHAEKLAQVLTAIAPPEVKEVLQPRDSKEGPTTAELVAQSEQLKAALEEAINVAQEAQQDLDEAQMKLADKEAENEIKEYEAETNRLKVTGANEQQIQAVVQQLITEMLESSAPLPGDSQELPMAEEVPAEPMPEEPMMPEAPPEPAPEVLQLIDGQEQLAQGQAQIAEMLETLAGLMKRSRKRIPVRNEAGDITEVIDQISEE